MRIVVCQPSARRRDSFTDETMVLWTAARPREGGELLPVNRQRLPVNDLVDRVNLGRYSRCDAAIDDAEDKIMTARAA